MMISRKIRTNIKLNFSFFSSSSNKMIMFSHPIDSSRVVFLQRREWKRLEENIELSHKILSFEIPELNLKKGMLCDCLSFIN